MTETPTLEDAVRNAIATFEHYAELHRAKATPEGTAKAEANELEAAKLRDALAAPTTGFAPVVTEEIEPALRALANYQQADMDGVMVTVSRQAIDEVLEWVRALPHFKTEAQVEEAVIERLIDRASTGRRFPPEDGARNPVVADWLRAQKGKSDAETY